MKGNVEIRQKEVRIEDVKMVDGYAIIKLEGNAYKGTGKVWIARINELKKIIDFVKVEVYEKNHYKITKTYKLAPGLYTSNEADTARYDRRESFEITEDGKKIEI